MVENAWKVSKHDFVIHMWTTAFLPDSHIGSLPSGGQLSSLHTGTAAGRPLHCVRGDWPGSSVSSSCRSLCVVDFGSSSGHLNCSGSVTPHTQHTWEFLQNCCSGLKRLLMAVLLSMVTESGWEKAVTLLGPNTVSYVWTHFSDSDDWSCAGHVKQPYKYLIVGSRAKLPGLTPCSTR